MVGGRGILAVHTLSIGLLSADKRGETDLLVRAVKHLHLVRTTARAVAEELVQLVERAALRFGHEPKDVGSPENAHEAEEYICAEPGGVDKVRRRHGHREVVEPVARRADRDALGAQAEREDLGDDDPGARAPAEAEDCRRR